MSNDSLTNDPNEVSAVDKVLECADTIPDASAQEESTGTEIPPSNPEPAADDDPEENQSSDIGSTEADDPIFEDDVNSETVKTVAHEGSTETEADVAPSTDEPDHTTEEGPSLADLQLELEQLRNSFDQKLKYDEHKEKTIDRMHQELQEHKADVVLKLIKPLSMGLIGLYDDVGKALEAFQEKELTPDTAVELFRKLLKNYGGIQEDIEELLYRNGIESFRLEDEVSERPLLFDPKKQRVLDKIEDSAHQHREVAVSRRKGFRRDDRVLRPELVNVYVSEK